MSVYKGVVIKASSPTVNNDIDSGFYSGFVWIDSLNNNTVYISRNDSVGAAVWGKVSFSNGELVFDSVVSPTSLSANTNDWTITGLSSSNVIYASTDGSNYDITGIDSAGIGNGQTYYLYNVGGSGEIRIKNNNGGSIAANRFITNGDVNVKIGMGVVISYDILVARWRVNYFK